jgi:hypothetical protein
LPASFPLAFAFSLKSRSFRSHPCISSCAF